MLTIGLPCLPLIYLVFLLMFWCMFLFFCVISDILSFVVCVFWVCLFVYFWCVELCSFVLFGLWKV